MTFMTTRSDSSGETNTIFRRRLSKNGGFAVCRGARMNENPVQLKIGKVKPERV